MLPSYSDIRHRIDVEPEWFDGNGVPRYEAFRPDMLGVYDVVAVLVAIDCQGCHKPFLVGEGWPRAGFYWGHEEPVLHTLESVLESYHYGDPPAHGCVGDTMNCIDRRVVEAWQHESAGDWVRMQEHENGDITPGWAKA